MTLIIQKPTGAKLVLAKDYIPVDPDFANVSLLLHGDGTNGSTTITDNSPTPKTVTAVGNAQISTAQSKFGGASIAFDGNGDYLTAPAGNDFAFGVNNFTVELWAYFSASRTNSCIIDFRSAGNTPGLFLRQGSEAAQSTVVTALIAVPGILLEAKSPTIALNQWQHIAYVRSSGSGRLYVDGVGGTPLSMTTNLTQSNCAIGRFYDTAASPFAFSGYIDDLRITKGVARYTDNFTPPTAPFPDIASR
jgi:hypothetical protein